MISYHYDIIDKLSLIFALSSNDNLIHYECYNSHYA